ncbi:primosomal protein [Pseudonocardia sp. HH130630-07]|uniref:primosomal protein n=1 Tax=Pseudonocardia sp. HH130630-07 TaxID=1690815 RepID=UPI00081505BE|nr:primosomal protein [Pseudonocardia sp. HH130630-07]ANY07511.1 primosomal protein [Pseudonocardia sp. HH130630-07]
MASDIVPIRLALTRGDVVTLWAPPWREDGEEWEAFLGDDDNVFVFDEIAGLAAFVRTASGHDLEDHPAWSVVPGLDVGELTPDDAHGYDLVGLPELAAADPDAWIVQQLHEIISIVRSLADVCDLTDVVTALDGEESFARLRDGESAFTGREGAKRWSALSAAVTRHWDDILDTVDGLVATPKIDTGALEKARAEAAEWEAAREAAFGSGDDDDEVLEAAALEAGPADDEPQATGFWAEVGIDPIRIESGERSVVTLRCYLDDKPVYLGSDGRIDVFASERAMARALADPEHPAVHGTDLAAAVTLPEVLEAAATGDLQVAVEDMNTYVLTGIGADLAEGVLDLDPVQLDLASELLTDVGEWAGDPEPAEYLAESNSLGWLVSFVVRPDPTRMAPSPPFSREAEAWGELVAGLEARLREH